MPIPFTKASACGNDFLIIEGMHAPSDLPAFARAICDRYNGVGADGVEWIFPDTHSDAHARLFNADGSEAEISGNGTRCVAAYLLSGGGAGASGSLAGAKQVRIRTGAGVKTCRLQERNGTRFAFETAMGEPQAGEEFSVKLAFGEVSGIPVSMGNPHFVVFVEQFSPGWQAEAAEIGKHHDFKYSINVELVKVNDRSNIEVRFYERGVGETKSSGTGSCAAAVASIFSGKVQSPVKVHAPGGAQTVRWEGEVFLTGPAQLICRGEYLP